MSALESKSGVYVLTVVLILIFLLSMRSDRDSVREKEQKKGADLQSEETFSGSLLEEINHKEDKENKKVFLTFDDGPTEHTAEVLGILENYGIPATFFVIGNQVTEETELLLQQAVAQGCEIGVHTQCHQAEKIYLSAQSFYKDVMAAKKVIEDSTGEKVCWFRFPWGSNNCYVSSYRQQIISMLKEEGLEYVDWNVSGEDSVGRPDAYTIFSNVKKDTEIAKSPVILLHDSEINEETVKALPQIIEYYLDQGYSFANLGERDKPCHFLESQ